MIGDLIGHRMVRTTTRYAHLERNAIREAAAEVAGDVASKIMSPDRSKRACAKGLLRHLWGNYRMC